MFTGFSDATIDFLWELRFHNERPWYNKRVLDLSCVREHDDLLFSPALTDALVRGFGFLLPYYDYLETVTRREDA